MIILQILLFPFAALFNGITRLRNHFYDIGHRKSFQFETMVICVGNLNIGGSGKTPMIEYLIRLLKSRYKVATLSRGYGRRSKGLRFVTEKESAATVGDEPYQLFHKFNDVPVTVCEERAFAIPHILHQHPETDVILMDDAFQHRSVKPQLNILLSEFKKPFYKDHLLPMGRLRESRAGAARADIVIITKCDNETKTEQEQMAKEVAKFAGKKPVFFSSLQYSEPVAIGGHSLPLTGDVILISGIANETLFEDYVSSRFKILHHFRFSDHHHYSAEELRSIVEFYKHQNRPAFLLTTEKDMVRLIDPVFGEFIQGFPWFFLPVATSFIHNGSDFDAIVIEAIEKFRTKGQ